MNLSPIRATVLLLALILGGSRATAQENEPSKLTLLAVNVGGIRPTVTEGWSLLNIVVANSDSMPRDARVVVFYDGEPNVQYARDLRVPAGARLSSTVTVGPAPPQAVKTGRNIQMLLFDRTDGQNTLIRPTTDEKVRARSLTYSPRERMMVVIADLEVPAMPLGLESPVTEAFQLTRILAVGGANDRALVAPGGYVPPTLEAYDGVDALILMSDRFSSDPTSVAALRRWVQQGGRLWIMLDLVDPSRVAALLGDDADVAVVDRVALSSVEFSRGFDGSSMGAARDFEWPVDFVRVVPAPTDRVLHTIGGWPASFVRRIGRGQILFTTLGARAWSRPRKLSEMGRTKNMQPIALGAFDEIAAEIRPRPLNDAPEPLDFRPILTEDIGYTVTRRSTATLVLGLFIVALLVIGILVRRSRRPEIVGWVGSAAAIGFMCVFLLLGLQSRQSVPPTMAIAAEVDVVPGSDDAAVSGLIAVYHPNSGPVQLASQEGAILNLDAEGLAGQSLRRVQSDTSAWHWDELSLPAGVRSGAFRSTMRVGRTAAVARFGPDGLEGRIDGDRFQNLEDPVLISSMREAVAPRLISDGRFTAKPSDALAAGQYLASTVLSDRQQHRLTVYRQLFGSKKIPPHLEGRDYLLAWAGAECLPLVPEPGARIVGSTLLRVPLEFERTPPGTAVAIPRAFVPLRRVVGNGVAQPTLEAASALEMRLRFQLPPSVLPLAIERATFHVRVSCPSRQFSVDGYTAGNLKSLLAVDSPPEPIRLEITDRQLLELDAQGTLDLRVKIGEGAGQWTIESMGLDVIGKTLEPK
ncbi:MAG TPA: hypothetical protein VHR66_06595 [Gemmataceae bacterium]|jgi:hypothetical protein|nr:hypothetical protein [Gemmataceae bacterium]